MIRAVFFDFYGTLAEWQPAAGDIQRKSAAAEGVELDSAAIERAYPVANALLDRENALQRLASRTPEQRESFLTKFEHTLLKTAGYDVPLETARAIWLRVRSASKDLILFPDARSTLEELRTMGYSLAVISNMGADLPSYLERMGIAGLVTAAVSSEEVGVAKPHPAMFEAALRKVGVEASAAIHVGDGYESDVLGAASAGLQALYLQRDAGSTPPGDYPIVRNLSEVPACVQRLNASA